MSIKETILEKLETLPPDQKQEVLSFIGRLQRKNQKESHRHSLKGLWADLNVDVTSEDIAFVRREMWGNFPRKFNINTIW